MAFSRRFFSHFRCANYDWMGEETCDCVKNSQKSPEGKCLKLGNFEIVTISEQYKFELLNRNQFYSVKNTLKQPQMEDVDVDNDLPDCERGDCGYGLGLKTARNFASY